MRLPIRALLSLRRSFTLLVVIGIIFIYCISNQLRIHHCVRQILNQNERFQDHPLPYEQCPRDTIDCPKRVLERNYASKWIVIWLPSEPEADVSHLTKIPGWKTVAVGDGVCPRGCRYPSCVFLDTTSQTLLGSSLASLLPRNDLSKKNLAYLYAIKQRASFIYDADVDVRPLYNLTDFKYGPTSGVVYKGEGTFNVYQHYGEHWFRPPGLQHIDVKDNDPSEYVLCDIPQPEVQVGLVKVKGKMRPRFQSVVPTALIGSQSFAPFESCNVMFNKRAFWGLITFPGRGSAILRSLILQTLLKYIHGFVGFAHPNALRLEEFAAERYKRDVPHSMMMHLYHWKCTGITSLKDCIDELFSNLRAENFINEDVSVIMSAWFSDLLLFGYMVSDIGVSEPLMIIPKINKVKNSTYPDVIKLSLAPNVHYLNSPESKSYESVGKMCENFEYPSGDYYKFDDIIQTVTFNYPRLYVNIPYVESLHRQFFPNILYCGQDPDAFRAGLTKLPVNATAMYVSGLEIGWMNFQECTIYAMKMNFNNVKGYLQIGDDVLLNTWNFRSLPRDQIWFNRRVTQMQIDTPYPYRWPWWQMNIGREAINKTFTHIEETARKPEDSKEKRFYKQYVKNTKGFTRLFHQTCDFFYIPERLREEFIYFTLMAYNTSLVIELGLPTIIVGLDDQENITRVIGSVLWGHERFKPVEHFNAEHHYLHAFKGIAQFQRPHCKLFMCNNFLPLLADGMAQPRKPKLL